MAHATPPAFIPSPTFAVEPLEGRRLLSGTSFYQVHALVADKASFKADHTDANLTNPWGMAAAPGGPIWVADNHSGVTTVYDGSGKPLDVSSGTGLYPAAVTIPAAAGSTDPGSPTGTVFNGSTKQFRISSGTGASAAAVFLFASEDGVISGWSPSVDAAHAVRAVDLSAQNAVFKGLTLDAVGGKTYLLASDFHNGRVEVFDSRFHSADGALPEGTFADPAIPAGFAPFNVQRLGDFVYVTYAKQNAEKHDDVPGAGNGFVDRFTPGGKLDARVASGGTLNSPWGLALAPGGFGTFGGDLLVGNFGDGKITALGSHRGRPIVAGTLKDRAGADLSLQGLWALSFGNGSNGASPDSLYFTAGPNGETDGLFGTISFAHRRK